MNKACFHASIDRSRTDTGEHCRFLGPNQGHVPATFGAPTLRHAVHFFDDQQLARFNGDLDLSFHRAQAFPGVFRLSVALVYRRD